MSEKILDGKAVAAEIHEELTRRVEALATAGGRPPQLVAVLVGDDAASAAYVRNKAKTCERVGMVGRTLRLPADISHGELEATIHGLNEDDAVDGILVQLPLPDQIEERRILELIRPEKDVDGFHPVNVGRLWSGEDCLAPATPSGVIEMLRRRGVELKGADAVIVGRSNIVGKPMAALLLRENATVTICHSRTKDLVDACRTADVLIAAVGVTALIGPDHVKEGAVVIDIGMNRVDDISQLERLYPGDAKRRRRFDKRGYLLTGDVDFHGVYGRASAITPVPGGVGPLTVAMVVANTLRASEASQGGALQEKGRRP
ncbi:MAG: bifunctional methylenetetrahydrofolate dehydrogenase/methenyltetrahydrofolate cyclohydrolase FolD [Acidobacteriota bacterium]